VTGDFAFGLAVGVVIGAAALWLYQRISGPVSPITDDDFRGTEW